jgi:hypothetical protein
MRARAAALGLRRGIGFGEAPTQPQGQEGCASGQRAGEEQEAEDRKDGHGPRLTGPSFTPGLPAGPRAQP